MKIKIQLDDKTKEYQLPHKGLFYAQASALNHFDSLIKKLKPESHDKAVIIELWIDDKVIKQFKTNKAV